MQDKSFHPLHFVCVLLFLLKNGSSTNINIQPNPVYLPSSSANEAAITCTGKAENVGFITSISLQRQLERDSSIRNLVTMSGSTPELDNNLPADLMNRNPAVQGFLQATNTSSYFTLSFNITDIQCSDIGDYTCVMTYINTSFNQVTTSRKEEMKIRYSPSDVMLTMYRNGTEVENVSENAHVAFNVGEVAQFRLTRNADNTSAYVCLRTNASNLSDTLFRFTPNVISTSTAASGDCNYFLSTDFSTVITEDDARRKNNYIVQCFVTSGTTVYSRKIYLGIDHDFCLSSPCSNGNCSNSDSDMGYTCFCEDGFTGINCDTDINECLSATACANNSTCTNTLGNYTCTCNTGFTGDGKDSCTDINECLLSTTCADNAVCTNTPGSFMCACNAGYTGDGHNNCTDVDECLSSFTCADNAECTNMNGSYACMCNRGFTGDGYVSCIDINECLSSTTCADNATCTNMPGSSTCTCNAGFTGDGLDNCTDVNECQTSNACADNAECMNTYGSYTCTCNSGFTGDGNVTCTDINECMLSTPCADNAECTNTPGSYTCACSAGFTGDGLYSCTDVNECLTSTTCADNAECTNTNGTYTCSCNDGFTGDGTIICTDINECLLSTTCTDDAVCTNTPGSYMCACNAGFTGDGHNNCTDVNECLSPTVCADNADCMNTNGSYTCSCNTGFTGDGNYSCTDIDECQLSTTCSDNAVCTNKPGSYMCVCNVGFTGDGHNNCTDVNECLSPTVCADNAECMNTNGSYTCSCNTGFTGDGNYSCTDIDECQLSTTCSDNAVCTNTPGSYMCVCNVGFTGDGHNNCTEVNVCLSSTVCADNAECTNANGSYTCSCNNGFTGNGNVSCSDINECLLSTTCTDNAVCTNTPGSYTCACSAGFTGDGHTNCTDVNECLSSAACADNAECANTNGSYTCSCDSGYTEDGSFTCTDEDECQSSTTCAENAVCTNTPGSYTCKCNVGFTGDGQNSCTDVNECMLSTTCSDNAVCTNTPGSYTCVCSAGFTGDGHNNCAAIDNCASNPCQNGICVSSTMGYTCTCNTGYTGLNCETAINHCASNPCQNGICVSSTVGYTCTCNAGYTGLNCDTDINECHNNPCLNSGYCSNYAGYYRCYCTVGWTGALCQTDINECSARTPCATNAACTNTDGSYTCRCNNGYTGDGKLKCTQNVLVDYTTTGYYYYRSDDDINSFYIPGGMEYYGKRYYYAYVSMNGYITLGHRYSARYPWTSSSSWRSIRYPIIAPLWTDIDTRGTYGDTGMYVNGITSRTVLRNTIQPVIGDTNFLPRYCLMVTWKKAVPYPYSFNHKYETADFQVLLATNSSYTYVMFNYDQDQFTWRPSGGRLVVVGYSTASFAGSIRFSSSNFVNVNKMSNVGINGRWRYSVSLSGSPIERAKALCINWYYDSYIQSLISSARSGSAPCPCSYSQVRRDWRYRYTGYSNGIYHYRQRWTQWPYSHRQRCHYKRYYSGWWTTRAYLMYGYPGGGYMESYDSKLEISAAYSNCCSQRTGLCHLFYSRNPSRTCRGYRPPSWRPANGDPHITTFDGTRYTFNGRGEYTLVEVKEENITSTVQVRTDLVNGDDPDATIFVGIAGKDGTDGDIVQVILDRETNSSSIYISGNYSGTFASANPESVYIEADRITVFNDSDKLVLAFESGLSVQVLVHNLLDIITSAPDDGDFVGNTKGLLGNNDGDTSNDFILKNGTILSVNSTEEQLFDFGMSWMIMENESLFNYTIGWKTFDFYNNITIRPKNFISDMLKNLTAYLDTNCPGMSIDADAIQETCGDNVACRVDAAATCNTEFGKASKDTVEQVEQENEVLENFPPNISAPDILYIGYMENKTVTLDMDKHVTDTNLDDISIETSIPEEQFSFENNIFQWNVSDELRTENKTVYVRFTANDTMGASSEYWPDVYYCGCEGDSGCDYSVVLEDNDNEDHFYSARCNCSEEREGPYCENIKDRCDPNPCYGNVTCDNTQSVNPCGACPVGMSGDGLRCEDTNECNTDTPPCNQTCENIIGSYICSCREGYNPNNDGHNCDDVDECETREANDCAEDEICKNLPGTFSCQCAAGYAVSGGKCEKVISSFVGVLVFETTNNNTVTGKAVEDLLRDEISRLEPRVIAVEVTELHKVEIGRRKRQDVAKDKYNSTFVLYSANGTLETEDVNTAFEKYKQSVLEDVVIVSNEIVIPISIIKEESKVYKDGEYGICNIVDKVTCDLETTICSAEDGIQTCNCKEGFEPWSIQYISCKDKNECEIADLCGVRGTCKNVIGSYTCVCDPGFRLADTGICTDICASNPCKNGGTCTHIEGEDIHSCQCESGWTGFSCEVENSEAERMQLIAIAVGASVGTVCIILLCISVLLWRRYKVSSKGYKHEHSSQINEATSRYDTLQIPRPSLSMGYTTPRCYRNDAYTGSTETFKRDFTAHGERDASQGDDKEGAAQACHQRQGADSQEYF